jgi:drug/metabolite transporter (DMT)-like permease
MMEKKAMFAVMLLVICIFAGAAGQVVWKHGMSTIDRINSTDDLLRWKTIFNIFINKYIIIGIILYVSVFLLWLAAMSTLEISFMYPMLSLAYILTSAMASIFLGEDITSIRWIGTVLVVFGCFLIAKS